MKKKNLLYFSLLGLILVLLILDALTSKTIIWTKSFSRFDKNPYGSYALGQLLDDLYEGKNVTKSNLTYFEILEEDSVTESLVSISQRFLPDQESLKKLLNHVSSGQSALISSTQISSMFQDTLGFSVKKNIYSFDKVLNKEDSMSFHIGPHEFYYQEKELQYFFDEYPEDSEVLAQNQNDQPILISFEYGKGKFILSTNPILFTNHFMLFESNHEAVAKVLSLLPIRNTHWTEYYQVGKLNSSSPLRVVLTYPPLKYALYTFLLAALLYMLFEAKRKQRIIPIVKKPANHTLQFIKTVGNLYLNSGNHKAAAMSQINFFKEYVALKLNFQWLEKSDNLELLAAKSGNDPAFIKTLVERITFIEKSDAINEQTLVGLNKDLHHFYRH